MQNQSSESKTTRRKALQVIGVGAGVFVTGFACTESGGGGSHGGEKKAGGEKHGGEMKAKGAEKAASKPAAAAEETKKPAEGGGELSCNEGVDDQSKQMRKTLQYVEKSPKEGKNCANCMQWKEPEGDSKCGGCTLFAGQVHPNGYCLSYAPKAA